MKVYRCSYCQAELEYSEAAAKVHALTCPGMRHGVMHINDRPPEQPEPPRLRPPSEAPRASTHMASSAPDSDTRSTRRLQRCEACKRPCVTLWNEYGFDLCLRCAELLEGLTAFAFTPASAFELLSRTLR